jgi:hypothetical protein
MRVLLDECLPRQLKREVVGHDVATVPESGWGGKKNGELLRLAAPCFDAFVTMDHGIRFQQNLAAITRGTSLGVITLAALSNRIEVLRPLVPHLLDALRTLRPGQVIRVTAEDTEAI